MPPIIGSPGVPGQSPNRAPRVSLGERIFRWVLLVPVLASALVTVTVAHIPHRSVATHLAAARQHRVTYVQVTGTGEKQKAVWSIGWTSWATTKATDTPSGRPVDLEDLGSDTGLYYWGSGRITSSTWNLKLVETLGAVSSALKAAGVFAFVLMLINGGGWVGNRWAWFWIFTCNGLGATGPILYLLLERQPLWITTRMPLPDKPAFGGLTGLLMIIPLGIGLAVGDALLTLLFN